MMRFAQIAATVAILLLPASVDSKTTSINIDRAKSNCAEARGPGDDAGGCKALGAAYLDGALADQDGRAIQRDYRLAIAFFGRACQVEDPIGCASVGEMYAKRLVEPLPDNYKTLAVSYYKLGCYVSRPGYASYAAISCMGGAGVLLGMRGNAATKREATRITAETIGLLERGCELGDDGQCDSVATLVR